jgi:hypothetical protein
MLSRPSPYHYCFGNCLDWMEYAGVRSGVVGATCAVAAPATGSTPSRGAGDATTRLPPPLNLYFTRYGRIFRAGGREGRDRIRKERWITGRLSGTIRKSIDAQRNRSILAKLTLCNEKGRPEEAPGADLQTPVDL